MAIVALLDGPRAGIALAALRATLGTPAASLALESFRRAGVEPGAGDAGWPGRLSRVGPEECHAIVNSSTGSGGLLDSSRGP